MAPSRMGGGGDASGGWVSMGGGMSSGDACTESSSRDYGTSSGGWMQSSSQMQGGVGGSAAWRPSQQHSGDWSTSTSSGYGSHGTHSSYEKPYEKTYDKYDTYASSKYSSRRY